MSEVFDLNAAVGEEEIEPFHFTWGPKQFQLPAVIALPVDRQIALIDAIDALGDDPTTRQIVDVLNVAVGKEMLAELSAARPLSGAGLVKLIQAWIGSQGKTVGKSRSKSASSGRTAPPSKRISRSTALRMTN